jgi:RimJ/RimL family protein N-acetyltransferase
MVESRIETERLILREWQDDDADAVYAIGQDARVMRYLGPLMSRHDAQALVAGQIVYHRLFGHCFWPIERRDDSAVIGLCGLNPGPKETPLADQIEIGWRLAHDTWGRGYAYEAAVACLDYAWAHLDAMSVAAMTVPDNVRSRRLMERLGMRHYPAQDFDHPALDINNPLRRHVSYRIDRLAS